MPDDVIHLPLNEIQPYWRNPRRIPSEAVDAVADSITRFGYQNLIIVDKEHVIVTGHTRYAALRKLGWAGADVKVSDLTPEEARDYRLVDNSTNDLTDFDHDKLMMELREVTDPGLLAIHFPDVDLSIDFDAIDRVDVDDIAAGQAKALAVAPGTDREPARFICPHCLKPFEVDAADLDAQRQRG